MIRIFFVVSTLLTVISCLTVSNEASAKNQQPIDGVYKEEEGSKWIEFSDGYFSFNYNVPEHLPMFTCEKLSYGKYKVIDDKFIELNSSDSILHTRYLFDDNVKKINQGSQDSIYIVVKKSEDYITSYKSKIETYSNLNYVLSYGLEEFNFSNKNQIQVKKMNEDDFKEIWLTIKVKQFPSYYSNGRYRGLTELIVIIEMEDYNYFEIDLSSYGECTLFQEYYKGELIRYEKNKIYWNGEIYTRM